MARTDNCAGISLNFDNSYARLPQRFYVEQLPTPVSDPSLIKANIALANTLGVDGQWLSSQEGVAVMAGNQTPEGAKPIATAYAGHQFGSWNPQLGDGRAVLLGELLSTTGQRFDLQLKGSGPTPWSRGGDGRAPIGPVLREYLLSESMAVLGVPTTRALAAVSTGELVRREEPQTGAVLTRVASSHIRIGTFQYFAARQDLEALELLSQHVIARHYPDAKAAENPTLAMLDAVIVRQASLVAKWQLLGFIHGVMNTDNVLLCGETVDYGPCAFMDEFHPDTVFSSIDQGGRYAYRNQPSIAHWNISNLAQCLLPLLNEDESAAVAMAQNSVDAFPQLFLQAHELGMNEKLGFGESREGDAELVEDLLSLMTDEKTDFTLLFRRLAELAQGSEDGDKSVADLFEFPEKFSPWLQQWRERLEGESVDPEQRAASMYRANPVFIPRNHLVEQVINSALYDQDLKPFEELHEVLQRPFDYDPDLKQYASPPREEQKVRNTFCGT